MIRIFINGKFLSQKITGVQRYAVETVKAMDTLLPRDGCEVTLLAPSDAIYHLKLRNIRTVRMGTPGGMKWSQWDAPLYARRHKGVLLTITGQCPVIAPDYLVFHDIVFLKFPKSNSLKYQMVYRIDYRLTLKRCRRIFAVSGFTRDEMAEAYGLDRSKISVAYNAADHMSEQLAGKAYDANLLSEYGLKPGEYYLSVGSVNAHKNQKFILELACIYPEKTFVITGSVGEKTFSSVIQGKTVNGIAIKDNNEKGKPDMHSEAANTVSADAEIAGSDDGISHQSRTLTDIPENVIFTGYADDDQLAALYHYASGFIFPSLYEGFGIPPLEAITMGTKHVAVSDIPVFREVFDEGVYRFNPERAGDFDFDEMGRIEADEDVRKHYREKYSWKKTAKIILDGIIGTENGKAGR